MVGAYILAGELHQCQGNYAEAFKRYQKLFGPFVLKKQQAALRFARYFVPKSKSARFVRNQVMNLMKIPWIADIMVGRDIADKLVLPEY